MRAKRAKRRSSIEGTRASPAHCGACGGSLARITYLGRRAGEGIRRECMVCGVVVTLSRMAGEAPRPAVHGSA
ncbi:MAG: hypothetical protein JNL80_00235 [Phycisphaerae bacterium]|nr:hypothetical protein [Phycisphaerae bacterium]